ncbi:uncharacterized protein LOC123315888 [Coccinella septempunctata]|uniref:uncharacterized protein LOC123315888 n=1 Tax=Coccinella septempunctata TaxID=41139 RepID=UPI001D05C2E8|nr:uncharacterized protein LOC123315888 [Coccinella septempunctata]
MTKGMKLCHLNVRSLMDHFDDFRALINDFEVVGVSETWLEEVVDTRFISIGGFTFYRSDRRRGRRGGGVGIYVSDKFRSVSFILSSVNDHCEQIWIRVKMNNTSFAIGCVYRPPKGSLPSFIEALDDSLSSIVPTVDELILLGDVNIDLLTTGTLINSMDAYGFKQLIDEPTRISRDSMTLLDPIFVTSLGCVSNSGVVNADVVSDHKMVFCELSFESSVTRPRMHYYRDFKFFDINLFQSDLLREPFNNIFTMDDIDEKVKFFSSLVLGVFEKHAPLRAARMTRKHAPWLTFPIKMMMKERDSALAKFKITKAPDDWDRYKRLRNFTLSSLRREKRAYYDGIFQAGDSRLSWKNLRGINPARSNIRLPLSLQQPELANNYFSSVFVDGPADDDLLRFYSTERYPKLKNPENAFELRLLSVDEVGEIISTIKSNAVGFDGTINLSP